MKPLMVELGERSYPIIVAPNALADFPQICQENRIALPKQLVIVTNDTVAQHYLATLQAALAGYQMLVITVGDGESFKSLASYEHIMSQLIAANISRDAAIIALGGGVVGDLAGFVAATYQRGVDFIQIPTTLLADVDSSVGGKTAVNHPGGKNLIGAFYQPRLVVIDPNCLLTLSDRDYRSGLAEVVKYGVIYDPELLASLEQHSQAILQRQPDIIAAVIRRCCEIKAAIVAADEREQGARALLNLGHTFGHAIEAAAGLGEWTHGEAVAAGMIIAAKLSEQLGEMQTSEYRRLRQLLVDMGLPVTPPQLDPQTWWQYMRRDKKVKAGAVRFVIPVGLGQARLTSDIAPELVDQSIQQALTDS
ncbi:3-dehydroquinate synthase [Idiomarina tyrosinivorans]|uniref:3-dehydroquinate synthase n=1 Tax=Idiomarina tyrosinivorans TaxID=1445662 RepID=A0A432ZPZ1_9GAMM|nr:3-dehydroquinate synthase [Idiomarina tyrosinivorans]RUO79912.1 3-dehydroquinate synthase [Idiomarina tyrosinivorans]